MGFVETGYLTYEEIKAVKKLPEEARFLKGPVAIAECVQEIPCNPCESACPKKAITIKTPITTRPEVDGDKCTGCGICVSRCPGLAIFVVNKAYSDTRATVSFPYEYFPIPEVGKEYPAVNRKGEVVCQGTIVKVMNPASFDHTPVVTIEIPKEYVDEVRSIERRKCYE